MKKATLYTLLAALCVVFYSCSCGAGRYSGDFRNIDAAGWAYTSQIDFTPFSGDSAATGALIMAVRHSNYYRYSNLYVEVNIGGVRDTFNIPLADDYGRWYGRGIGTDFQKADTLYPRLTLRQGETVTLRHIMRADTLGDIEQVGLSFIIDK